MDIGESEAIALAEELHADLVIMDESAGRRVLAGRGIAFIGTVGVLMQAKQQGLIPTLKPELDRLAPVGFISPIVFIGPAWQPAGNRLAKSILLAKASHVAALARTRV